MNDQNQIRAGLPAGRQPHVAKISLCMIVGNVEEYIERCLKSFLPMADEVVLVRAIGNQKPDDTIEKAKATIEFYNVECLRNVTFKFAEYKNKAGHEDWPHIDDFGAARQMSFDLGTGDYLFWCDSDDVLEPGAAALIREHAERGGYPCFTHPYNIFGRGITVMRDRMIARGAARWKFPVHETFEFMLAPQSVADERVVITHLPHLDKSGSNPRNLRILQSIPESEMTTGLMYHYHVELAMAEDIEGSIAMAKKCLEQPDLARPEKYEIFLNLAQATKEPNTKAALLQQAYGVNPGRREALFLLANNAMNFGQPEDGLAYAQQMMATLPPKDWQWTDRKAVYGWVGDDLYSQALRANGFEDAAEKVRLLAAERAGGYRVALVHATRGRPEQAAKARKIWLDTAARPDQVEHIFVFDSDDEASKCLRRFNHREVSPGGGCVRAWNVGAFATTAPIVIQMSDDWTPPMKWDELILERFLKAQPESTDGKPEQKAFLPRVLAVSDGHRQDELLCMAIVTRPYLLQDAYFFHPEFKSMYSDNWFTHLAYQRGQVIEARDLVFTHNHPVFDGGMLDKTYAESNAPARYAAGEALFKELVAGGNWANVPGFFDYFPFYDRVIERLKDGDTAAEIGVWLGRSLIYLAQGLKRAGKQVKLLAVDHFRGEFNQADHAPVVLANGGSNRGAFEQNLKNCGVREMIDIIESDSASGAANVPDESLAFVFIDAAHDYESVKRDIAAWLPKLKPDGLMAGHDAEYSEVARAVKEAFPQAVRAGSVWMWVKPTN